MDQISHHGMALTRHDLSHCLYSFVRKPVRNSISPSQASSDVQSFRIKDPVSFTKYIKFEFLRHSGSEFYCPIRFEESVKC